MNLTFGEIIKIIELSLTIIGLLFVIFGWIIPHKQSVKTIYQHQEFEKRILCAQWEKELLDKQISEFYGPIAELLREQDLRMSLIVYQLGRDVIFHEGQGRISALTENDQKIWMHFIDTYSIPIQARILDIIQNNQHLIYKSEMPECFKSYMEYVLGWELLDNQKRNNVPNNYEYYYAYNYPAAFNHYIEKTLMILLKRQEELMKICL